MNNELLVNNIKKLCKENQIKIHQLEKEVDIGAGTISRWVKSDPTLSRVVSIADFFHVTVDDLIGRRVEQYEELDLVTSLSILTSEKMTHWNDITTQQIVQCKDNYNLFNLCRDQYEVYETDHNKNKIYIVAEYNMEDSLIVNLSTNIYIMPENADVPILQKVNERQLENLWLSIHSSIHGMPDQYKAERVKLSVISEGAQISAFLDGGETREELNETLQNPKVQELINVVSSEEFKKMQQLFSNPEFKNAIKFADQAYKYLYKIES